MSLPAKTHCPYCAESATLLFSVSDINQNMSDEIFDYYQCHGCGLIFLDPIPENIHDYYGQAYSAYQTTGDIESNVTDYDLSKLKTVRDNIQGDKLLEIGPGNGTFAYLAKKEGYIVDTIEMDSKCSKFLAETIKVRNSINSSTIVETLKQIEERYDAIVMWHVLEHLESPWSVLSALPDMLAPNGVVIIAVPNPGSFQFKIFKKYWKHVDAPRHTMFLPANLLGQQLVQAGLQKVLVTTTDSVSSEFNSRGWWLHSLNNFFSKNPNRFLVWLLNRSTINFIVYSFVRIIERTDGSGNAYLAIFRKPGSNS
ncbi:MAG: methyltransferase domain-containing protein [Sideroxydans sp.]|nr:methyltransferase domain-containing protein [Sideroxydans sp.]